MIPVIHSGVVTPVGAPHIAHNRAERRSGVRADRKLRRALGAYSPIVAPGSRPAPIPRYIRRHTRWLAGGTTRKHKRERARVIRISRRYL